MSGKVEMLFVCGAGLGSSFAAQMATEDVLNKYHVDAHLRSSGIFYCCFYEPRYYYYSQLQKAIQRNSILMEKTAIVSLRILSLVLK